MSIVPSVVQILGLEAQESAHPLEFALAGKALSLEGAEQLPGIKHEYTFGRGCLRQEGGEPVDWCLDGFRFEVAGRGRSKTEPLCSRNVGLWRYSLDVSMVIVENKE